MQIIKGDILKSKSQALINTVNTVGVMGKGIALLFKEQFEENFKLYQIACKKGEVKVGKMFITETNTLSNPKFIINFPTKEHWKGKSTYEFIRIGLVDLVEQIQKLGITEIAIPPLGCGNGGLDWKIVRPMIEKAMASIPNIAIELYEPTDVMPEKKSIIAKKGLTPARAMILKLLVQYQSLGYAISLLEIQKLAYFLQEAGEDLRLKFQAHYYGPYADNLRKVLEILEDEYIFSEKRIADSRPFEVLELNQDKIDEVEEYILKNCTESQKINLQKVSKQINGFESPFGMELLATTHWVVYKENAQNLEQAQNKIYHWAKNPERKQRLFDTFVIKTALERLNEPCFS